MATQSPMRPAWTCPHCGERWYSGREYCGTCHYGMVQDGVGSWVPPQPGLMAPPPAPVPPPVAPPPGEAVSASAPSAEAGQALPLWQQLQVARAEAAQLKEEVSLRQELATRRDRELAEAERQLHAATERAQQWEAWMRQVLGRLAQAVRARGYATEADAQAVDMAVQLVTSGLPGPARGPVAPAGLQPEDVWQAVAQL